MAPLTGTLDAYSRVAGEVDIRWEARSGQAFGDLSLESFIEDFDLLVIDHPFVGRASAANLLVALDTHLSESFLVDQAVNSVGQSHRSYQIDGHQWALAIDAAAQVSAYRSDVFQRLGLKPARTWDEAIKTAEHLAEHGLGIAVPLGTTDSLMALYSLSAGFGHPLFSPDDHEMSRLGGRLGLALLRRLWGLVDPETRAWDDSRVLDSMVSEDRLAYAPLLFGYSNYSRAGSGPQTVRFANPPAAAQGKIGSILGGAGFAVSRHCSHVKEAVAYGAWLASGEVQRGPYFDAGGQPGHRAAWVDPRVNAASHNFFARTLATLDGAYLRPRFDGYHEFQLAAGQLVADWLVGPDPDPEPIIDSLWAAFDAVYDSAEAG